MAGGVSPQRRGKPPQSRCARQLPQRGSRGRFAPFLPPAFMRGEGHAVAGGVPRRSGGNPLSHGFAVPALPRGEPRELRSDNWSFRTSSQTGVRIPRMRGTAERQALPPAFMRGEGHAVAGGVSPPQRGRPSQSRFARQLSQRESQGGCAPFLPPAFMRGEGHEAAGGVPRSGGGSPPQRQGKPPQSRLRRASSPRGEAEGVSPRSCPLHL